MAQLQTSNDGSKTWTIFSKVVALVIALQLILIPQSAYAHWIEIFRDGFLVAAACAAWCYFIWKGRRPVMWHWLDYIFLAFVGWNILSIGWSTNISLAIAKATSWSFVFVIYKLAGVLSQAPKAVSFYKKAFFGVLTLNILVLASALLGMAFTGDEIGVTYRQVARINEYISTNANEAASVLVLTFTVFLAVKNYAKHTSWFTWIVVGFTAFAVVLLNARAAIFALYTAVALYLLYVGDGKKKRLIFIASMALGAAALTAVADKALFVQHLNPLKGMLASHDERFILWQSAIDVWQTAPILGVGAGNWVIEYPRFAQSILYGFDDIRQYSHAHQMFLQMLSELGLIGLGLYVAFFVGIAYQLNKNKLLKNHVGKLFLILVLSYHILASFYGIIYAQHEELKTCQILFFVVIGYVVSTIKTNRKSNRTANSFAATIAAIMLALYAFIIYNNMQLSRAKKYHVTNDYELALKYLASVQSPLYSMDKSPNRKVALKTTEAKIHLELGHIDLALASMHEAIAVQPYYHYNYFMLGNFFMHNQSYGDAIAAYDQAIELNGNYFSSQLALVDALIADGQEERAVALHNSVDQRVSHHLKKYSASFPDPALRAQQKFYKNLLRYNGKLRQQDVKIDHMK